MALVLHALRFLPKNALSRAFGRLARATRPAWFARWLRNWFARRFAIDLSIAERPMEEYATLMALFTRRLRPGVRPIDGAPDVLVAPVDGTVGAFGAIAGGRLIQAKGLDYSVAGLLGDAEAARPFEHGFFITFYLAPKDYHRIHAPIEGTLDRSLYEPGTLWPVNAAAVRSIPRLFAVNERVTSLIRTARGAVAVAMVGATNVGSIHLAAGDFRTNRRAARTAFVHGDADLARGAHLGTFELGSTVVVLIEDRSFACDAAVQEGRWLAMGSRVGTFHRA